MTGGRSASERSTGKRYGDRAREDSTASSAEFALRVRAARRYRCGAFPPKGTKPSEYLERSDREIGS
ncbi:hypothetical protein [Haladaptatus salinisoli]|uniref:hypothetical protein n=1 Tax=Haladaptatus salinisoli TaxID=2884876 RepID=UPI001D0ADF54|nr:hypothetical protein [Haladaptatus salinisoli]